MATMTETKTKPEAQRRVGETRRARARRIRRRDNGLSLLELMVVLAIIGLVAVVAAPQLISYLDRSKVDAAEIQVKSLSSILDLYRLDMGRFPTEAEGLDALASAPAGADKWRGPYIKSQDMLIDPWGNPYRYLPGKDGAFGAVVSFGADGREGGDGIDADISG